MATATAQEQVIAQIMSHPERIDVYAQALRSVDAVAQWSQSVESLPPLSPQTARAIAASEQLWQAIDEEYDLLTATELGRRLGSTAADPSSMVAKRQQAGKLLWVRRGGRLRFPDFQIDPAAGEVHPAVPELVAVGRVHGFEAPQVVQWLMTRLTSLNDERPVDILGDTERVLGAADRSWNAEW